MRVKKDKNYSVISNCLLRDKDISLKAKGLLCVMLSLPDKWEFSIAGLAAISHEGETSIRSTLKELEQNRYLERGKVKDKKNKVISWDYIVYEKKFDEKDRVYKDEANRVYADKKKNEPHDGSPVVGNNHVENQRQRSKEEESTQQESTYNSQQTDSSANDAPIPSESVRREEVSESVRKSTKRETSSYRQKGASPEKSAAGIVKKKPLVKNLTNMDDKDIKLLRAALLGKEYGMAIMEEVPFSMQCGTDHGTATLTMEVAFDYWLDHALYRESAREAYLSKFLEAWKNICDNCADRFWMPARGGDGYVWQNVIKGYANNWNPGTPSERREAKARDSFNNP